ncbi:MAG: hypothetical protein KC635_04360 [Myxococcales bacterium]|nr:hypothetical protein [Myxococcales bacterium]MCB9733055.1 hypothetical protein [Deltaproteobacteria bacterium]
MVDLRDGLMHQVGMSKEKAEEVLSFLARNPGEVNRFLAKADDGDRAASLTGRAGDAKGGGASA